MKTKLVLFGITGDLSRRKLLPALRDIVAAGECQPLSIIGVSRREVDVPVLLRESIGDDSLADITSVYSMDLANPDDYRGLAGELNLQQDEQAVVYLSVPPSAATDIVDFLGEAGLNTPNVKILFEKPFGFDEATARAFIQRTARYFTEDQVYRIDHYMAKEVAAAVIALRHDAASHHHRWSNVSVARIDVVASETIGVEGRATFYEQTGALRDVVQGHLLQLLSLVLLQPIGDSRELPTRRLEALTQLNPAQPTQATRAQYEGYSEEVGNPGSRTETFVRLEMTSSDPRWQGVPLTLTTGKSLNEKKTAIRVQYTDGDNDEFIEGDIRAAEGRLPDAYERVLVAAIKGDKRIFTTSPEIIQAWHLLEPLQKAWNLESRPLEVYKPGASPEQAGARS